MEQWNNGNKFPSLLALDAEILDILKILNPT